MFVGHYGVSFAAKRASPSIPTWVLFIAVQLLDVIWAPLVLLRVERVRIAPGITASNPFDLYYMPFTHSLVAAVLWSAAAFGVYWLCTRRQRIGPALVVAASVFSHWVLDLIVHRPDLPLYDDSAKVGFGLWNHAPLAFGLETGLLFGGMWLYLGTSPPHPKATVAFGVVMLAIQAYVFFGPPPTSGSAAALTALACYASFAVVIWVLDRRRGAPVPD